MNLLRNHYICRVIKNKYISFSSMFIAWAIIFVHSIIPHNHHNEPLQECQSNAHTGLTTEIGFSKVSISFSSNDHECDNANHCHFNINTTLTKFVDNPGINLTAETITIPSLVKEQTIYFNNRDFLFKHFYFDSFSHRGPPAFS